MYFNELARTSEKLAEYEKHLSTFHDLFLNKSYKKLDVIFPELLRRFDANFRAVNYLIKEFWLGDHRIESAIGNLLRAPLQDSMMVMYAMSPYHDNISGNKDEILNEFFDRIKIFLSDQVLTLIKEIKNSSPSTEQRNLFYKNLISDLPFLFNKTVFDETDFENVEKLLVHNQRMYFKKEFGKLPESSYKSSALGLYECFNFYSKYFHFGFHTMAFREYKDELLKIMIHAIAFSVSSCTLLAIGNKDKVVHGGSHLKAMQSLSAEIKEIAYKLPLLRQNGPA